jgi:hypothetical protein
MSLRAIFFDLDDTLCDTIGTRGERIRKAFERVCADYPQLDVEQLCGRALEHTRALESLHEPRAVRAIQMVLQELELSETEAAKEAIRVYVGHHEQLALFLTSKRRFKNLRAAICLASLAMQRAGTNEVSSITSGSLTTFNTQSLVRKSATASRTYESFRRRCSWRLSSLTRRCLLATVSTSMSVARWQLA